MGVLGTLTPLTQSQYTAPRGDPFPHEFHLGSATFLVQQFLLAGDIGVRGKIAAIEIPDTSYIELAEKNPKKAPVFSQGEGVRKITMT